MGILSPRAPTPQEWGAEGIPAPLYINVPGDWQKINIYGQPMPVLSSATYRLQVKLPEKFVGRSMGLLVSNIKTSYRIFIDNEQIMQGGNSTSTESDWEMGYFASS